MAKMNKAKPTGTATWAFCFCADDVALTVFTIEEKDKKLFRANITKVNWWRREKKGVMANEILKLYSKFIAKVRLNVCTHNDR